MPGPFDQQKAIMAQRMAGSTGAPPSGLGTPGGSPPPQMGGQQPLGAAPPQAGAPGMNQQPSEVKPLLDQAFQVLLRGNPADVEAVGEFLAKIKNLYEKHNAGQGQMQMGAAPPAMSTP